MQQQQATVGAAGCGALLAVCVLAGSVFVWSKLYGDYSVRAQVASGYNLTHRVKNRIEAFVQQSGELPSGNEDAGLPPAAKISDKNVSQVGIENGTITVVFGNNADSRIAGNSIVIEPQVGQASDIVWTCLSPELPEKWLPEPCESQ